jgi:hypothetical protein
MNDRFLDRLAELHRAALELEDALGGTPIGRASARRVPKCGSLGVRARWARSRARSQAECPSCMGLYESRASTLQGGLRKGYGRGRRDDHRRRSPRHAQRPTGRLTAVSLLNRKTRIPGISLTAYEFSMIEPIDALPWCASILVLNREQEALNDIFTARCWSDVCSPNLRRTVLCGAAPPS